MIKNKCETLNFYEWFVGYTDGDGCFNVYTNNNKIIFTYKLSQKTNNEQVLHYMKKQLKCGSVRQDKRGMSHYLIRNKNCLEKIIIPLFDNYPLQTIKYNNYIKFRTAFFISKDDSKTQKEKIIEINNLHVGSKNQLFLGLNVTKSWIIGFIEAEGSFYLVKKDKNRIVHGFGLTQKYDKEVLEEIRKLLKITSNVCWNKKGFWSLNCTNSKDIKRIKDYFFKTMKSRKSLIYRIWSKSFSDKGKYNKLLKIQQQIRLLR